MTISATMLRLFVEALETLRVDRRELLETCGIDAAVLRDPDARIERDRFEGVWVAAQELSGDACIGLHAGGRIHPHAVNLFGYLLLSSATLGTGLRRISRYQRVLSDPPWIEMDEASAPARLRVGISEGGAEFRAIHAEYVAALIPRVLSWVSEVEIAPEEARFRHDVRGPLDDYETILRCKVRFGAKRDELLFGRATLDLPSRHAEESVARLHEELAARLLAREGDAELTDRVRRLLAERLESGETGLLSVARELGMGARSLQRRLANEGTSYRELLDSLRCEVAREYLERDRVPIAAVAHLAGFSDASAFTRAATRWFGRTPARVREEARHRRIAGPGSG